MRSRRLRACCSLEGTTAEAATKPATAAAPTVSQGYLSVRALGSRPLERSALSAEKAWPMAAEASLTWLVRNWASVRAGAFLPSAWLASVVLGFFCSFMDVVPVFGELFAVERFVLGLGGGEGLADQLGDDEVG